VPGTGVTWNEWTIHMNSVSMIFASTVLNAITPSHNRNKSPRRCLRRHKSFRYRSGIITTPAMLHFSRSALRVEQEQPPAAYTQVITKREAAPPQPRARERVAAARETRREDNMSHQDPGANGVQPDC
jgi:hypothetical protein